MHYFQISKFQLDTLTGISCGSGTFVQIVPEKEKDEDKYTVWLEHTVETLQLLQEGLMKEITRDHLEFVKGLEEQYGRKFKIYSTTEIGQAMFGNKKALEVVN